MRRAPLAIGVAFLDELASAVPSAGAPDVRSTFGGDVVDYTWLAAALLAVPTIVAVVLEAPLVAASDRWTKKHVVLAASLAVMAGAFGAAAFASSLAGVSVALAVAFPACGIAGALAEAMLIGACADAGARARAMARWTLAGAVGDAVGPLVLALALGWRGGASAIAAVIAVVALLVIVLRPADGGAVVDEEEDAAEPRATVVREVLAALRRKGVVGWLLAATLCTLLDETLIAFAALHWDALAAANEYGRLAVGVLLAAFAIGGALSLVVMDVLLARWPGSGGRLLALACVACALSYGAWLVVTGPVAGTLLFFVVGACAAPLWPSCQARVYELFPGRPGLAGAASTVFSPLDVAAPVALGLVADRSGVLAALALLLLQPLGILALLAIDRVRGRGARSARVVQPGRDVDVGG
jgi:MFS transporter, FSR family, fosmidomycin resistance protein